MRRIISSVAVAVLLGGFSGVAAQLPPEVQADAYLLEVEQSIDDGNYDRAWARIQDIQRLQTDHGLDLPEFHFWYAKAADAMNLPEQALESVTEYLTASGREASHYVEALALMNKAQDEIEGRKDSRVASPGQPLPTQPAVDLGPDSLSSQDVAAEPAEPACEAWNTEKYFQAATVENVTTCLTAGADPNVRGKYNMRPVHWAAAYTNNPDVIKALIAAGANLSEKGKGVGNSASWWDRGMPGASSWENWFTGMTPLDYAAAYNENPAVAQALIAAGDTPKKGWSKGVLGFAAINENPAVAQVLIDAGADVRKMTVGPGLLFTSLAYCSSVQRESSRRSASD